MKTSKENKEMPSLKPFLRQNLDVLFIALNPPEQSNSNGHYFSGDRSRFFHLLHLSGLITEAVDKTKADTKIFGNTDLNYKNANFGVVDLIPNCVETNSNKVRFCVADVEALVKTIRTYKPKFACVIHSKVVKALNRYKDNICKLTFDSNAQILRDCETIFFHNYFPNGNNIKDCKKIEKFREIKKRL